MYFTIYYMHLYVIYDLLVLIVTLHEVFKILPAFAFIIFIVIYYLLTWKLATSLCARYVCTHEM